MWWEIRLDILSSVRPSIIFGIMLRLVHWFVDYGWLWGQIHRHFSADISETGGCRSVFCWFLSISGNIPLGFLPGDRVWGAWTFAKSWTPDMNDLPSGTLMNQMVLLFISQIVYSTGFMKIVSIFPFFMKYIIRYNIYLQIVTTM